METETFIPITTNPIKNLVTSQLDLYTKGSLHAEAVTSFDPLNAVEKLKSLEGARVIGADFGGDKGLTQLFVIKDGALQIDETYTDYVQSSFGDGYLASLEKTAAYAQEHNIPVGISWGSPLVGTKPVFHPKVANFLEELQTKYEGDIANIVPTLKLCLNDGPAGLISGVIEANRTQPTTTILFPINGGGIGMAALVDNTLYSSEAGHVQASQELNMYHQDKPCGVFGATYLCVETLCANKAGIEAQWQTHNDYLRARDIEDRYKAGDMFAGELYDNSAYVLTHAIQGTAKAFDIDLTNPATAVVGHGGAFKFPHYGERVSQFLDAHNGAPVRLIMTKDYGNSATNACLDGAALVALLA